MINIQFPRIGLILLTITICVSSAFSWDEVGHKLTTYIAWQQMQPDVREKVFKILLKAPEDSDLSVPYDFFNSRSERIKRLELFMYASIWADVIKDRKFPVRNKTYSRFNWHFSDIFWSQKDGKAASLQNFDGSGGVAIPKLYDFEKTMRDPISTDAEKAVAIAWFLHVGGDIHNPLHNASRVTKNEPKGDQGGNLVTIRKGNSQGLRRLNLHGYWDSIIGNYIQRKNDQWDTDYLAPIARKIIKRHPRSKMLNRLKLSDYKTWNIEGFNLLPKVVYTSDIVRNQMPSKKYRKRAFRVSQQQIALAGYRLGETLNRIFGNENKTALSLVPSECKIIRKVLYPVSKRRRPDQKMRFALLDICPPNKGMVARPTIPMGNHTKIEFVEYDVIRVFETKKEAKKYAKENGINNASY